MAELFERLPFEEANRYLAKKIRLPTAGWTDIWQEQHSHAFVIAGANQDALLEDMYNAIVEARDKGMGYPDFRKSFDEIVARHGWTYNGGAGWRSKIIYDTNMRQSYNAGRWQQIIASGNEYLMYRHTSHEHPRLQHKAWNNLVLPVNDPWWHTHFPSNGWRCQCKAYSMSTAQAKREWAKQGKTQPDVAPEIKYVEVTVGKRSANPRTVRVPEGIDPGFAYNPGKAYLEPFSPPPQHNKILKQRGIDVPVPKFPLPVASKVAYAAAMLPASTAPVAAVEEFLSVFEASIDKGAVFFDALGYPMSITKALFVAGDDKEGGDFKWLEKPDKLSRLQAVKLLAWALLEPDEIWQAWEEDVNWSKDKPDAGKRYRLKRRYLKIFEINDRGEFAIVAFEWGRDGWVGSTTFMIDRAQDKSRLDYFNKQRVGERIYPTK